jgi:hypothetical protein
MKAFFSCRHRRPSCRGKRRRHQPFGRSTPLGRNLVQPCRPRTKQSLPACSSSWTRVCAASARLEYIRADGGHFLATGGRTARGSSTSYGHVHSVSTAWQEDPHHRAFSSSSSRCRHVDRQSSTNHGAGRVDELVRQGSLCQRRGTNLACFRMLARRAR